MNDSDSDVKQLLLLLQDESTSKRRKAAKQLGRLKAVEALDQLAKRLEDPESGVVQSVIRAMIEIGGPQTVQTVIPLLEHTLPVVRNAVTEILVRIGGEHLESVMSILAHEDDQVRKFGIDVLGQIGDPACANKLESSLSDVDANVRCSAAEALAKLNSTTSATSILAQLKREKESWVIFHLLEAISMLGRPELVDEMIDFPLEQLGVCQEALLETVSEIGSVENFEKLLSTINVDNPAVAAHVIQAVLRISQRVGGHDVLKDLAEKFNLKKHLSELAHHDDMVVRLNSLILMDRLDTLSSEDARQFMKSDFPDIRLQAIKVLIRLGDSGLKNDLLAIIKEPDAHLRYEAILGLSHCQNETIENLLLDMLKGEISLVQIAIIKTLTSFNSQRGIPLIKDLLICDNPQVRKEAEDSLKSLVAS
jgi:HEAT repeat protein